MKIIIPVIVIAIAAIAGYLFMSGDSSLLAGVSTETSGAETSGATDSSESGEAMMEESMEGGAMMEESTDVTVDDEAASSVADEADAEVAGVEDELTADEGLELPDLE